MTLPTENTENPLVFLAGSIDLDPDSNWRREVVEHFGDRIDFVDPTNPNHNRLNDKEMRTHINWELQALEMADFIFLNFLPEAKSPISLAELGMYVASNKLTVVCPLEFYHSRYVTEVCARYATPIDCDFVKGLTLLSRRIKI